MAKYFMFKSLMRIWLSVNLLTIQPLEFLFWVVDITCSMWPSIKTPKVNGWTRSDIEIDRFVINLNDDQNRRRRANQTVLICYLTLGIWHERFKRIVPYVSPFNMEQLRIFVEALLITNLNKNCLIINQNVL